MWLSTTTSTPPASGSCWPLGPDDTLAPDRRVVRRLGGGGAHEAFLVDTGAQRCRAVAKLPRPHFASDPHCLLKLKDEAHALERLVHPSVPRHLETVLAGRHPHLLLEYVPGPTLHQAIAIRDKLSPPLVAQIGCALARTLDHIAGAGWVHLDVKPSNIVLHGSPRLLDFELARPIAEAAEICTPAGTWGYMPPEQRAAAIGDPPRIGPPADVFALGVTLAEALTGRLLCCHSAPLPGRVGAVVGQALLTEPDDRPTAAELADALAGLAHVKVE